MCVYSRRPYYTHNKCECVITIDICLYSSFVQTTKRRFFSFLLLLPLFSLSHILCHINAIDSPCRRFMFGSCHIYTLYTHSGKILWITKLHSFGFCARKRDSPTFVTWCLMYAVVVSVLQFFASFQRNFSCALTLWWRFPLSIVLLSLCLAICTKPHIHMVFCFFFSLRAFQKILYSYARYYMSSGKYTKVDNFLFSRGSKCTRKPH